MLVPAVGTILEHVPMSRWYYARNKEKHGPFSSAEIRVMLSRGQLQPTDMVIREGEQKWVAAKFAQELVPVAIPQPTPVHPATAVTHGPALFRRKSLLPRALLRAPWVYVSLGGAGLLLLLILIVIVSFGNRDEQAISANHYMRGEVKNESSRTDPTSQKPVPERPEAETKRVNPEIFKALYRAGKQIGAAQDTGLTRADFRKLLQEFATESSIAKDSLKTSDEKRIHELYGQTLEIWLDSGVLWDAHIEAPRLSKAAERRIENIIAGGGTAEELAQEHRKLDQYQALIAIGGLPIQSYADKKETAIAALVKRYSVPVKELRGWKYVDFDSVKLLWQQASAQFSEANKKWKGGGRPVTPE